ncbi:hypothetical protein LA080_001145 [Diaporthe eres]|nr:hypothetical protein LA080_001145 [Diaporthe eres]
MASNWDEDVSLAGDNFTRPQVFREQDEYLVGSCSSSYLALPGWQLDTIQNPVHLSGNSSLVAIVATNTRRQTE